eukprot:6178736-Pleurochrysis_carterae.AAC.2
MDAGVGYPRTAPRACARALIKQCALALSHTSASARRYGSANLSVLRRVHACLRPLSTTGGKRHRTRQERAGSYRLKATARTGGAELHDLIASDSLGLCPVSRDPMGDESAVSAWPYQTPPDLFGRSLWSKAGSSARATSAAATSLTSSLGLSTTRRDGVD